MRETLSILCKTLDVNPEARADYDVTQSTGVATELEKFNP